MNDLSIQAERYASIFSKALKLYPAHYRQQYGEDMLQLFRDQLAEAEQFNDQHILKETFLHALLGLPGSIVKEYFNPDHSSPQGNSGRLRWLVVSLIFFGCFVSGVYLYSIVAGSYSGTVAGAVLIIASWITAVVAAFLTTRRLLLALATLGAGILAFLFIGFGGSALELSARAPLSTQPYYLIEPWFAMALVVVPPLIMYGLASWFHMFPQRFRRRLPATMSQEELRQFSEKVKHRRQLMLRWSLSVLALMVAANLVGLYDPPTTHADLDLPIRRIPDGQNMYFEMDQLSHTKELLAVTRAEGDLLPYSDSPQHWKISPEALALTNNSEVVALYRAAASKSFFQDPNFADVTTYKTVDQVVSIEILQFDGFYGATGAFLAKAEQQRRLGQISDAIMTISPVLKVVDAVSSSQGPIITLLAANFIKQQALELLTLVNEGAISASQREQIQAIVQELASPADGMILAIKTEFYTTRLFIEELRGLWRKNEDVRTYEYGLAIPALLPYAFQPNRTLAKVSDKYREQIADFEKPCNEIADKLNKADQQPKYNPYVFWLSTFKFNGIGEKLADSAYYFDGLRRDRCQIEELTKKILHP